MLLGLLVSVFNRLEQQQQMNKKITATEVVDHQSQLQSGINVVTFKTNVSLIDLKRQNQYHCSVNLFSRMFFSLQFSDQPIDMNQK